MPKVKREYQERESSAERSFERRRAREERTNRQLLEQQSNLNSTPQPLVSASLLHGAGSYGTRDGEKQFVKGNNIIKIINRGQQKALKKMELKKEKAAKKNLQAKNRSVALSKKMDSFDNRTPHRLGKDPEESEEFEEESRAGEENQINTLGNLSTNYDLN